VRLTVHPLPPHWACLHKRMVPAGQSGPPALGVFWDAVDPLQNAKEAQARISLQAEHPQEG
jgi:hypothetical protein